MNDQNVKISHNSPPDSWPVCFTLGMGAKRHVWGLASPKPMLGATKEVVFTSVGPFVCEQYLR